MIYSLTSLDILSISIYFVVLMIVFIFSLSRSDRFSTEGYFLAGRNMNWILVGMSLFSTNIGAEHFLGLAGSGAATGISAAAFEIHAMLIMQMLSWIFVPVLVSAGVKTMPEYFSARLGGTRIRTTLAIVYLLLYILTKVSVNIYAGALFIQVAFGWNLYYSIFIVLGLAALFTIGGGLAAVMYTDTFMSVTMLIGGSILCILSFKKIKYMPGLYSAYMNAVSNSSQCGQPKKSAFQMLRGVTDSYMPWLGFFIGHTPNTIWYWCSDQMMVQRVMSAKSAAHARGGTLLTGFLKITPLFLMVFVGMISRTLFVDKVGCARSNCTNRAYPEIAMALLPKGLKGLHLAVMISALVSGLTSLFNSSSTLFTLDIYRLIRKNAQNTELMIVGRTFALIIILLAIGWIPLVIRMNGTDIYIYIQSVNSFFASPITCIYLLAVLWKGLSEKGAFFALISGFGMGITRMILEFAYPAPSCDQIDKRLKVVSKMNFMYFSAFNFFMTSLIAVAISYFTEKPLSIKGTMYQTRKTKGCTDLIMQDPIPLQDNEIEGEKSGVRDDPSKQTTLQKNIEENTEIHMEIGKQAIGWAKKCARVILYLICGLDQHITPSASLHDEYQSSLDKFDESKIPKKTKNVLRMTLLILGISVVTSFIVLSLDPKITFQ